MANLQVRSLLCRCVASNAMMRRGGSRAETGEATTSKGFQLAEQMEQEVGEETELAAIPANEFR